ncbi:MAG: ABC transporter substrate-binding protein [Coriobacteriales bacterium]|nr:ABC transporter substrate-binding protein [Coriobacteriales bacterium]
MIALTGCGRPDAGTEGDDQRGGSSGATATTEASSAPIPIKIGVLPTEDSLPFWVADADGQFEKAGLAVELVAFQAAAERDAALSAGSIDGFMGDLIAAANLDSGGVPVTVEWVMLGQTPEQGRFGIVEAPADHSGFRPQSRKDQLRTLRNVPIGTSSATIQEYILDGLMTQAGVPADQVKKEEVKKVPVRFELLMQRKLRAAALPEPFLSLAEKQGATLIADDTKGENLSQTVFVVSDKFLAKPGAQETIDRLRGAWNKSAALINSDPDEFRVILVEEARLPKPLEKSYKVNEYPQAAPPTEAQVDAVLAWMKAKGYSKGNLTYDELVAQ